MDDRTLILVAGAIGAIFGTVITAVANIILAVINRRSEERKQLNELMIKTGVEQHSQDFNAALKRSSPSIVPPLETYLLHNYLFISALDNRGYRVQDMEKRIRKMREDYRRLGIALDIRNPDGSKSNMFREPKP